MIVKTHVPGIKIAVFMTKPNAGGGIQIFAKELAENMASDIEMFFISRQRVQALGEGKILNTLAFWRYIFIQLRKFDLILMHQFSLKYYFLAKLSGRPIVIVTHIWDMRNQGFIAISKRRIKKYFLNDRNLRLVYVSNSVKVALGLEGEVISNRSTFTRKLGDKSTVKRDLLYVGRFTVEKGVFVFLDIVKQINSDPNYAVTATMIGEGPESQNICREIIHMELQNCVELIPWITRSQLREKYLEHRILIVPSLWDEPYGLVASEGLALGLTVFCSNRPGLVEATLNDAMYFDPSRVSLVVNSIKQELNHVAHVKKEPNLISELDFVKTVEKYQVLFQGITTNSKL